MTQQPPDYRKVMKWGLMAFLLINAFSWNPGWGGGAIERYFGWPACFYCDLWRADHHREVALPLYFPPIPLSREMDFQYCSVSIVGLLLNAIVVACGTGLCLIYIGVEGKDFPARLMALALFLGAIIWGLVQFGDHFSAYL